jgi:ribosomal protein L37AE/L43A
MTVKFREVECPYCHNKQIEDEDNDSFVCEKCDEIFHMEDKNE